MYYIIDSIIKIIEKAITDLKRTSLNENPTVLAKLKTLVRDESIRNAWLEIKATPPWSVNKFILELSGYEDHLLIETIEQGIVKRIFFTITCPKVPLSHPAQKLECGMFCPSMAINIV